MLNIMGLKSRTMVSLPLDIPNVEVSSVHLNERGDYIITVESTQGGTICQHCGRKITKSNGHGRWIELRHLAILGHRGERYTVGTRECRERSMLSAK